MPFFNNIKLNQGDIMKEEFRNLFGYYCAFTEDSIITSETPYKKAVIFPYGSIEKLHTFLGVSIDSYNGDGFGFAFSNMNKATKIQIKKICKTIKKNQKKYSKTSSYEIEIDESERERIKNIFQPPIYTKHGALKFWIIFISIKIISLKIILSLGNVFDLRNKKYDDVFEKDPNTWTEDEKEYVDEFFEWQKEQNDK